MSKTKIENVQDETRAAKPERRRKGTPIDKVAKDHAAPPANPAEAERKAAKTRITPAMQRALGQHVPDALPSAEAPAGGKGKGK